MRLHFENESPPTRISSYGEGYVIVNDVRHTSSIILYPDHVDPTWARTALADVTAEDIAHVVADSPAIVLLGTGRAQHFPPAAILEPAYSRGIGVEVMNTMAACRTFNVLAAENRDVIAALILET